jgi:hypothetical protein
MPLTTIRVPPVEDEIMIRMMVSDMVEELGHAVAAEAGTLVALPSWLKRVCLIWLGTLDGDQELRR